MSSLLLGCIILLPQLALAAEADCGSDGAGMENAPEYVPGPEKKYQLEQPFGGSDEVANIGEYIQLVYQFALGVVGIFAVVLIMFGGLRWIAAAGNESIIGEAKEIVTSAITGLTIALLSYVILAFINPQTLETDVSVFKIPLPPSCPYEDPEPKVIPSDAVGLIGNGRSLCAGAVDELVRIADYMVNGADGEGGTPGACETCKIGVSSGLRTHEKQRALRDCYERAVEMGVTDGSSCPDGCNSCNLAEYMCCSEHEHGKAVDVWFEGVPADTGAAPSSEGYLKQKYNNGGGDNALALNQQLLRAAMTSSAPGSQYSGISNEWWHFNYTGSCDTEIQSNSYRSGCEVASATGYASNFICSAGGVLGYAYAVCDGDIAGCSTELRSDSWSVSEKCPDGQYVSFADKQEQNGAGAFPDYTSEPDCITE